MADVSRPLSFRLSLADYEQLQARAYSVGGSPSGVARDLIRTGLIGGDNKALAERLTLVERRLAVLEQQGRDLAALSREGEGFVRELLVKFDALLAALSGDQIGRAA